jgi:adenylosuccinate lyase
VSKGLEVHRARIRQRIADELPFMATEALIVRAVQQGGDRQVVHEVIRRHSVAAAQAMKNHGKPNDLLERLAADPAYPVTLADARDATEPRRFVGRAPEQVEEFLTEVIEPVLGRAPAPRAAEEVRV